MTPPDSGEREVTCDCGSDSDVHRIECARLAYLREPPTPYAGPPPMPEGWIAVSASLAQRILVLLEGGGKWPEDRDQAVREIRARLPR